MEQVKDAGMAQVNNGLLDEKEVPKTEYVDQPLRQYPQENGFGPTAKKRLLRKLDLHLLPMVTLLYLLSYIDRTNIGNAKIAGLEKSLGMKGLDYSIAVAAFYPCYIAAEIPSNIAMKRFRPSIWIPFILVSWGICCTLMGLVHNFQGLIVARCFLGLAEGGLFPGINYYITMWYPRHECGFRMAMFFSAATASGAFGGLMARGIVELDGVAGRAGWSWLFIIEGLLTVVSALGAFKWMHDYPQTAKFLTGEEKEEVVRRLEMDRSDLADEFDTKYVWQALKDFKIWWHMLITIGIYIPISCISIFLPTIVKDLCYSNTSAQLLTVPPYIVACVACVVAGYAADKLGQRGLFMVIFTIIGIIGFAVLLGTSNTTGQYIGCFLITTGIYTCVPQGVAWNGNNIGGSLKRSVGIAMHVGFGNIGGIVAAFLYQAKDQPRYLTGHATLLGFTSMSCILSILMSLYLRRENRRRDATYKHPQQYSEQERRAERDKGDDATFFRYTI